MLLLRESGAKRPGYQCAPTPPHRPCSLAVVLCSLSGHIFSVWKGSEFPRFPVFSTALQVLWGRLKSPWEGCRKHRHIISSGSGVNIPASLCRHALWQASCSPGCVQMMLSLLGSMFAWVSNSAEGFSLNSGFLWPTPSLG